ncbi:MULTISPECIES: MBL fold metallo-hydrolase [Aphanothece]|uniref:MBL fold metallo-hydrolase n=1 Tax=Aphanothece TaxID=1121 RepID=UPI003985365C
MRRPPVLVLCAVAAALLFGLLPHPPLAAQGAAAEPFRAAPVRGPVAVISGEGGNIGVLTGPEATLLVDAKFERTVAPVLAAVQALGGQDPAWLINTHFHFDHTDGNAGFARRGATIVAQEKVRTRLAQGSRIAAFDRVTPPAPPEALPVVTFEQKLRLHIDDETVDLLHLPAAHTDTDAIVHFVRADVIHTGDVWFNGSYPFIDTGHGGTLAGAIAGVDRVLALAGPETRIIPGHGPVGGKDDLESYRAMLALALERLSALKQQGLSLEQVVAAQPLLDLEARWGQGLFPGDRWIAVIWEGF